MSMSILKVKIFIFSALLLFMISIFFGGFMRDSEHERVAGDYIIISLNSLKFKIHHDYFFKDRLTQGKKEFKESADVSYFAVDFLYPSLKPIVGEAALIRGYGDKVMLYVSAEPHFDFKRSIDRWASEPIHLEDGFGNLPVLKFERKMGRDKESSADTDIYIYGDYEIFMQCPKDYAIENVPSPSCKITSSYKGLEISANFLIDKKFEFVNIKQSIVELLQSFEQVGDK